MSRPIIIGVCPDCAGQGQVPAIDFEETGAMAKCLPCDGLGDLDAYRLMAAYRAGVEEGIRRMAGVGAMVQQSLSLLQGAPEPSLEWLKAHVSVQSLHDQESAL